MPCYKFINRLHPPIMPSDWQDNQWCNMTRLLISQPKKLCRTVICALSAYGCTKWKMDLKEISKCLEITKLDTCFAKCDKNLGRLFLQS